MMKNLARMLFYRCYFADLGTHRQVIIEISTVLSRLVIAAFSAGFLVATAIIMLVVYWIVGG